MREAGHRERKKAETKRQISDIATALFLERGFDAVSVAEIAEAAGVSKMTVFNYFARKEDMLFDREEEGRDLMARAVAERPRGQTPLAALRALATGLHGEKHPFAKFSPGVLRFWQTVEESAALSARVREMRDDAERDLARALAAAVGKAQPDAEARMVAAMAVGAWRVAYAEGIDVKRRGASASAAGAAFLREIDRAFAMVAAAAKGTPYA